MIPYAPPVVVVPARPRRQINPLIPVCALGLCLLLLAATIVLSLIPLYISRRGVDFVDNGIQSTTTVALRNGSLPLGRLNDQSCQDIQTVLRQRAQSSSSVSPSVPTVVSCDVSTTATNVQRKKRQAQGNLINVVFVLSRGRQYFTQSGLSTRLANFLIILYQSDPFILNLLLGSGVQANILAFFLANPTIQSMVNPNLPFFGLNNQNQLLSFNAQNPSQILSTLAVTGLIGNDRLLSIDFRPATGQLYGISNGSRLYQINQDSGLARPIGNVLSTAISGSIASIDFNPTVDRLRVVTNTGQNLRLNPETGAVAGVDTAVAGGTIVAVAYNNSRAGVTTTTLFDIDSAADRLFQQNPSNDGTLVPVGGLFGVDLSGPSGFDISPSGVALASLLVNGVTQLYLINLSTGLLQQYLGNLPQTLSALAIPSDPVAYTVAVGTNNLIIFNPLNLTAAPISKPLTGLGANESIVGLDFRPVNGQLYALGNANRLFTINTASAQASVVGTGATFSTLLSGTTFGFDFNPTVDRIRVISNTGQNLRLNPDTGGIAGVDIPLQPNNSAGTAAAYTNNVANATTTVLFVLDTANNRLAIQNPPNNGTLVDVGPLGIAVDNENGFDIGGRSTNAFALLTVAGATSLYQINLATGAATRLGAFSLAGRALAIGLGF